VAKFQLPDALKADVPATLWGKILTATPVIMTVVATALAGLASSEMTRAQYARSLAAQRQSKAGDQWGFFQAKRLRGTMQRSTLDILQSTTTIQPFVASGSDTTLAAALERTQLPAVPAATELPASVKDALAAVEGAESESNIAKLIAELDEKTLESCLQAAKDRARAFDEILEPINRSIGKLETQLAGAASNQQAVRDFIAARLRYTAARYDAEARLNQAVAYIYELQVRRSNMVAERHHRRSQRFFLGMLAAQAAVIIATFSLATQKRNLLWGMAAAAGTAAISFAIYVYLFV
jgi:hypothetical protein